MGDNAGSQTAMSPSKRPPFLARASLFRNSQRLQVLEAQQMLSFGSVILIVAIDFMGLTIQNPLLPFYAIEFSDAKDLGVGAATSMLLFSYALSQFIATPLFGFGSDRFGRKPMFLLSVGGSALGFLGQAFAGSFWTLCGLRFATGLFGGSRPVAVAYIGDMFPPEQQPKYISFLSLAVSISMFLAPILGGSMGLVDLGLPCFFQSFVSLVVLMISVRYLREPSRKSRGQPTSGKQGTAPPPPARPYKCWLVANGLVGGLLFFCVTGWQTVLPVHASSKLNLDQNAIGLLFGASGLTIAIAQFAVYVPLSRKVSVKVLGCAGIISMAVVCAVPLFESDVWFVVLASCLQGFGMALTFPNVSMTVNMLSPPEKRGTMISLTIMFQSFTRVIAPLITGPMYDSEMWLPFVVMLWVKVVALALEALLIIRVPKLTHAPLAKLKQEDDGGNKVELDEEADRKEVLENLHKVHEELTSALRNWRERKDALLAGKTEEELGIIPLSMAPPVTEKQKQELGVWFADMLWQHNYKRWPEHLDTLKCMCKSAFPKIRDVEFLRRCEDIEHILESHLMLEQQWEHFVMHRSIFPLGNLNTADFDLFGAAEVESRSRTNSEADTEDPNRQEIVV